MARPARFSREQLQAAALAIVDTDGPEGLTMRSLAAAVGTGPMTIYNHVADRAELDLLVADAVVAEAGWSRDPAATWEDESGAIATALWRALAAHPRASPLVVASRSRSPAMLEVSEALLEALARSGREGVALLVAFRSLTALVLGFATPDLAAPPADVVRAFRSLPRERFAHLRALARVVGDAPVEAQFAAGLDALLHGLSST